MSDRVFSWYLLSDQLYSSGGFSSWPCAIQPTVGTQSQHAGPGEGGTRPQGPIPVEGGWEGAVQGPQNPIPAHGGGAKRGGAGPTWYMGSERG